MSSDPPTLVDEDLFRFLLDLEIQKAGRLHYCVSVVCLAPQVAQGPYDPGLIRRAAAAATRAFRATDVVSTLSHAMVCTLLVNAETRDLPEIFRRTTLELASHVAALASGQRITWTAGGSCYPVTAMTGAELLRQATDLTTRARAEDSDTLRLPG